MKRNAIIFSMLFGFFFVSMPSKCLSHDIVFCGERIPIDDRLVADKLMNIIRKQIKYINMPQLRKRVNKYFGIVEYYLRSTGLPEDFKYLAIVESGFQNLVSPKGAGGYWQIMPKTAAERGLIMNEDTDERNDINKSTHAACKEIARNYLLLKRYHGISSWVLTAAAYNYGIGNISKNVKRQGTNYFQMQLNAETAEYVYKIIAVKELFEYPELYMKDFGYNIFNTNSTRPPPQDDLPEMAISSVTMTVNEKDGNHPDHLDTAIAMIDKNAISNYTPIKNSRLVKPSFVYAQIIGKYRQFNDGDLVSFELKGDLQVGNNFVRKGSIMQWQGWIIDNRVLVDLGYGRNVILYDSDNTHGISFTSLKKKKLAIIMIENAEN